MEFLNNKYVQIGIIAAAGAIIMLLRKIILNESPLNPVKRRTGYKIIAGLIGIAGGLLVLFISGQLYIAIIAVLLIQFLGDVFLFLICKGNVQH